MQVGFTLCEPGSYAVGRASTSLAAHSCALCPFGATCLGGSRSSDGLLALRGFYGIVNASLQANFYLCPQGYCCNKDEGCEIDFCQGRRTGALCGRCAEGEGLRFFREGCESDNKCGGLEWFVPALCVAVIAFVIFLLRTTGNETTATLGILMFFYQVVSLVKSSEWRELARTVVVVQSIFKQAPTGSSQESSWGGLCLFRGMTQKQKLLTGLLNG